MAIVIPSKHIYSKSFDPVIDNNIDKVEVEVKNVSTHIDYETVVYNSEQNITDSEIQNVQDDTSNYADNFWFGGSFSDRTNERLATAIILKKRYINIGQIIIPKAQQNKYISSITQNADTQRSGMQISITSRVDYYENIRCGYAPNTNTFNVATELTPTTRQQTGIAIQSQNKTYTLNDEYPQVTAKITVEQEQDDEYNATGNINFEAYIHGFDTRWNSSYPSISISQKTLSILNNEPTITDNGDSYTISGLTILCGYDVSLCYAWVESTIPMSQIGEVWAYDNIRQTRYNVVPLSLSISVYGNEIVLDLQDETETIGDGKNVFSFDGNELIQSINTPLIESKYQGIIDEWKNGKQTAVITCPITDYYDENGDIAINTTGIIRCKLVEINGYELRFQEIGTRQIKTGTISIYFVNQKFIITVTNILDDGYFLATLVEGNSTFLIEGQTYITEQFLGNQIMTFHEGDIVIPYIYTNKGDKPLSYNKDFTPKKFKVVGTKISKRQGGMQELTLLEYKSIIQPPIPPTPPTPVFTITFNGNGGTLMDDTTMQTETDGKLASLPSDPIRDGYNFIGWYTEINNGVKITTNYAFHSDTTVYAHWKSSDFSLPYDKLMIKIYRPYTTNDGRTFDSNTIVIDDARWGSPEMPENSIFRKNLDSNTKMKYPYSDSDGTQSLISIWDGIGEAPQSIYLVTPTSFIGENSDSTYNAVINTGKRFAVRVIINENN